MLRAGLADEVRRPNGGRGAGGPSVWSVSITLPPAPPDALGVRLPISARLSSGAPAGPAVWGGSLPALPRALADAVAGTWGAVITVDAGGADPLALPGFGAAFAQARADQVVRAFSRRTNLVLAGATTAVVGAGPISDALTAALTRIGSRVVRVSDDPVTRLRAHLAGIGIADVGALPEATRRAHYVVATGEGHEPVDPTGVEAVLIDASLGGTGIVPTDGPVLRPRVRRAGGRGATLVDAPPPFPDDLDAGDGLAWRLADLVVALALLVAANGGDLAAADALLAREVIA